MAAATFAARPAAEVMGGGEHEQAGVGVEGAGLTRLDGGAVPGEDLRTAGGGGGGGGGEVAGLTRLDGGAVPGEDLRTAGMVERQAARVGFAVVSRHLVRNAPPLLLAAQHGGRSQATGDGARREGDEIGHKDRRGD